MRGGRSDYNTVRLRAGAYNMHHDGKSNGMRIFCVLCALLCHAAYAAADDGRIAQAIADIGANVVFMRHALAPGFGDPPHFAIGDCSTQRNLDAQGIAQAQRIGDALRRAGIQFSEVLSSQWCRCRDTAQHLALGEWREFAGLNSFFQFADKGDTLRRLAEKLNAVRGDALILMVTHQVVIAEVTGVTSPSGGLVAYNTKTGEHRRIPLP